jgi:hypothetical protein
MSEAHAPGPEFQEWQDTFTLLSALHEQIALARGYQQDLLEAANKARQPMDAASVAILVPVEDEHIPARHDRIVFGPRHGQPTLLGLQAIVVRVPVTDSDMYPDNPPAVDMNKGERRWNDVFLEVWDDTGESQNYLLNSQGLVPFDDAEYDVADNITFQQSADLFRVARPAVPRIRSSVSALAFLIEGDYPEYVFQRQSNNGIPPFFIDEQ